MTEDGEFFVHFDQRKPYIFGGPKDGPDETWTFGAANISTQLYSDMALISQEQFWDLVHQQECIAKFIEELSLAKAKLGTEIDRRMGQERLVKAE